MADEKRCSSPRIHKPHLWSRTTRKTVAEETSGDTFHCAGSARVGLRSDKDEMITRVRASIEAGKGRSMFDNPTPAMNRLHAAMCRCGVPRKPSGISKHVNDDGLCTVHPDRPAQPWVRGAGS